MKKSSLALAALLATAIIWGVNIVVLKVVLKEVPPFSLAFIRFSLASLIISPIFIFDETHHPIHFKDLPKLIFLGVVGVTFHISLLVLGIKYTTATNAAIISALSPLGVAAVANMYLKEKISNSYFLGSFIALFGILIIFGAEPLLNGAGFSSEYQYGNLLMLSSIATWAIFNVSSKELFKKYTSFTITAFLFLTGMVTFAPLAYWEYQNNPQWVEGVSLLAFLGLIYAALFSSVLAYLFYEWGLERVKASTASLINYVIPVVTVITAVVFLGEVITVPFLFGAALVITGLVYATHKTPPRAHPQHRL